MYAGSGGIFSKLGYLGVEPVVLDHRCTLTCSQGLLATCHASTIISSQVPFLPIFALNFLPQIDLASEWT